MKKELLAAVCVLTMLASTAPIFAADTTTNKNVVLTSDQIAKLTATQTKLTDLITKIEGLKTTYKNTTKGKGLLVALNQYEKQAKNLNAAITKYLKNPTAPANNKIKAFNKKTKALQWKVAITGKVLKKINTTTVKPVKPVHPVVPVKSVTSHNNTCNKTVS